MIGLRRHTVQVVDHNPGWAALAAEACQEARSACGDLLADLQHVGSTSVPDLPAKPILDLAAAVRTLAVIPELIEKLTGIGYIYRGDGGENGGHLFVRELTPDVRTIHLHVVVQDGQQWRNYLLFRDLLRRDAGIRKRYAELKKQLGTTFRNDRKAYTAAKEDFIRAVLKGVTDAQSSAEGNAAPPRASP